MNKTQLEHGGEAEAPPVSQRSRTLHWKGQKSGYNLMALPFPQANTASYGEVSPEPMVYPMGKGGGVQPPPSVLGHFMESHTLVSTTRIAGSLWVQSEKFYYDKEGRGVSNNQSTEPNRWYIVNMKLRGV